MKVYLSADIEGTAGIVDWSETTADHPQYAYFQQQMTKEVAAACRGALDAGAAEILVKDAHGGARNIIPTMLPEQAKLFRGWNCSPEMMMAGIDESFDGVIFTGYHAAAGTSSNPLAHTMSLKIQSITCNGRLMSEFDINALIAAHYGVPVYFLSGDAGLCRAAREVTNIHTVATNEGRDSGAITMHPNAAVEQIRESVSHALTQPKQEYLYPVAPYYQIEVCYKEHIPAAKAANYPGVIRKDAKTVCLEAVDFMEIIRAFFFIL
ncbi:MAG TPA: M55 family metallopeptidase [Candidatus Limiplasma sp.]|nr:M55 family metallopeptidase [Candidatus Limiplasma sp.]